MGGQSPDVRTLVCDLSAPAPEPFKQIAGLLNVAAWAGLKPWTTPSSPYPGYFGGAGLRWSVLSFASEFEAAERTR
jgi:hypothetical protein